MDTLRSLIALLLLSPALASATSPSNCALSITSGSIVFTGPFVSSGPSCGGFTIDGNMLVAEYPGPIGPANFFSPGGGFGFSYTNSTGNSDYPPHLFTLTINGVVWDAGSAGIAGVALEETDFAAVTPGPITGAGTFPGTFTFSGIFVGLPAGTLTNNCNPPDQCIRWDFSGAGTALFDVKPSTASYAPPNSVYIAGVTGTFEAPEPSTMALLLLGLAALSFQVWARAQRENGVS